LHAAILPTGDHDLTLGAIDLTGTTTQDASSVDAGYCDAATSPLTFACSRALTRRKGVSVRSEVGSSTGRFTPSSKTIGQTPDGRNTVEKLENRNVAGGLVVKTQLHHETGDLPYGRSGWRT